MVHAAGKADGDALARRRAFALARGLLQLADAAGMPDTSWRTDRRVKLAREVLGVPEDGRYTHDHLWDDGAEGRDDEGGGSG